jgi:16S rRNA C1402 (ribose-2'-O) methylase RsmI
LRDIFPRAAVASPNISPDSAKNEALYVDPGSLCRLLKVLAQILPTRQIAIAMDLTTCRETLSRGRPGELLDRMGRVSKDSAVTVIIEGYGKGSHTESMSRKKPRAIRLRGGE